MTYHVTDILLSLVRPLTPPWLLKAKELVLLSAIMEAALDILHASFVKNVRHAQKPDSETCIARRELRERFDA
jgi:hypothetical protein